MQAARDRRGLPLRALGREPGGEESGRGDQEDVRPGAAVCVTELARRRLQHLIGVEVRVFAQDRVRQRRDQPVVGVAEAQIPGDETGRGLAFAFAVEGVQQRAQQTVRAIG